MRLVDEKGLILSHCVGMERVNIELADENNHKESLLL